jgi:hypothetical protein
MSKETCPDCGKPNDHIHLDEHSVNAYKQIHEAAKMAAMGSEIERTRSVSLHSHADLLDHLKSDNGHIMGAYANYRNSHDEHIPGVRPIDPNWDHELSHRELIALHQHDHNKYPEDPHTTIDGEHFHH